MCIKYVLFDLDETLYPPETGLWPLLRERIELYMHEFLAIPDTEIPSIRRSYYETFGTTLKGLERDYGVRPAEFLSFVHDVPINDYILKDDLLFQLLQEIPQKKYIFTNADIPHAQRVLQALGVSKYFEDIIDVIRMTPYCKPNPQAFTRVMEIIGDDNPAHYILLDDSEKNIETARQIGMKAILVSPKDSHNEQIQRISYIHELQYLWDEMA